MRLGIARCAGDCEDEDSGKLTLADWKDAKSYAKREECVLRSNALAFRRSGSARLICRSWRLTNTLPASGPQLALAIARAHYTPITLPGSGPQLALATA